MNHKINTALHVLVIGDIMIDHYIYGNCSRISPEAPVQVVEVKRDYYTLGGAGNVLQNLIALNCTADIVSVTGDDEDANVIEHQLNKGNVCSGYLVKDNKRCTTVKSRVMVQSHQLIRLDREVTHQISDAVEDEIVLILKKLIAGYDIVLISDYNKGLLSASLLKQIFSICKANNKTALLDPKGADFTKYKGVNIVKPNKKEASIASGIEINDKRSLKAACIKIQEITNCDSVVITMSEEGIAIFSGNVLKIIPTKVLDVVDVTGAGDTVLASLGVALASGNSLYDACDFANHAAAVVVSKVGSATATLKEIEFRITNTFMSNE
jgi:rfaE bifunctional protein kinase chain/domain